ncbi:hypothetical protein D0865_12449 [Hortaea werneckii]|uniref:SWIM-type domain-containing protein n=1 Tax=Hortaea werneckii TaxID=91943 RepID=A0A3M7BM08_HORWE|nr:hypothetical protein D0865_12449 [Hortaea werneckii]
MTNIPTPRQLATKLVDSLPRSPDPGTGNPLHNAPESKQYLLSLHVLFPNELLPALDLLDRGLVTRMYVGSEEHASRPNATQAQDVATARPPGQSETHHSEATDGHKHVKDDATSSHNTYKGLGTYQVRSAQQTSSRGGGSSRYRNAAFEHTSYYEVRINAWSCSCPAFAFSAFPVNTQDSQTDEREFATQRPSRVGQSDWIFGGLTRGQGMPISCVLVEHSEMFSHCVQERSVSREEMAGWAAGWGD